jgi:hypothetical protein
MKTLEILIDDTTNPNSLSNILSKNKLNSGDSLLLKNSKIDEAGFIVACIMVINVIAVWFAKENKNSYADKLLDNIFKGKTLEDIEAEMLKEYGITVKIDRKQEQQSWYQLGRNTLERSYGEHEPDYESLILKEPNPGYIKNESI